LAAQQGFSSPWNDVFRSPIRWLQMMMRAMDEAEHNDKFIWKQGRDLVTLCKAGDSWLVSCLTQGRLLGPRQKVYEAMHRQAKFAAWDVMAKVISVSHNEDEGVEVAVQAAQWMRRMDSPAGSPGRA
jgi:hypothetical protein